MLAPTGLAGTVRRSRALRLTSFRSRLGLIGLIALLLRVLWTVWWNRNQGNLGDTYFYHWDANLLAAGQGYIDPFRLIYQGKVIPTAGHPPLWPFLLSVVSWFGGRGTPVGLTHSGGDYAHRLTGGVCGMVTVILIGLLGRRVAGERVGLIAAGLAAIYPILIVSDGSLMSEALYAPLVAGTLLLAYRLRERPTVKRALALGAVLGLAALTRTEVLMLLLLLILPLVGLSVKVRGEPQEPRVRWRTGRYGVKLFVCVLVGTAVVIAPWTIRNWHVFGRPVLVTTGDGAVLAGANCHSSYYGRDIGFWHLDCISPHRSDNEAVDAARWKSEGIKYAREHIGHLPVLAVVRVMRTWELYQPFRHLGNPANPLGLAMFYVLALLAIYGVVLLRRRGRPLLILLAPIALVTINSALTFGTTRFRLAAEIPLIVLAAVALAYVLEHGRIGPVRWVEMDRRYGPPGPPNSQTTSPSAEYSNQS
jgi:hypothetical protein